MNRRCFTFEFGLMSVLFGIVGGLAVAFGNNDQVASVAPKLFTVAIGVNALLSVFRASWDNGVSTFFAQFFVSAAGSTALIFSSSISVTWAARFF
jgi:hypothetical protein